jgi:SAM-dependent methyltransferase
MNRPAGDAAFSGSVPTVYQDLLVPMLFEPYAADIVARLAAKPPTRLLEIAAGTGVVTRAMAAGLPASTAITATDLNPAMIEKGQAVGTARPVTWQPADALQLPFGDGAFDAVVVQYGVMFYPDKAAGHREAHRVLANGGTYLFNVWEGLEQNVFAEVVSEAMARVFPDDPPRFLSRAPYGYADKGVITADLAAGGFANPRIEPLSFQSRANSARDVATAYVSGTPMKGEIEARDPSRMGEAIEVVTQALADRFGTGPIEGKIAALVVTATKQG